MNEIPEFTQDQKDWICCQIGAWYLKWKYNIADFDHKEHCLGYAKEELKTMICEGEQKDIFKVINDE